MISHSIWTQICSVLKQQRKSGIVSTGTSKCRGSQQVTGTQYEHFLVLLQPILVTHCFCEFDPSPMGTSTASVVEICLLLRATGERGERGCQLSYACGVRRTLKQKKERRNCRPVTPTPVVFLCFLHYLAHRNGFLRKWWLFLNDVCLIGAVPRSNLFSHRVMDNWRRVIFSVALLL